MMLVSSSFSDESKSPSIETELDVPCAPFSYAMNLVQNEWREIPVLISDYDEKSHQQIAIFWSKRTRTYTIIKIMKVNLGNGKPSEEMACMIDSGVMTFNLRALADRLD